MFPNCAGAVSAVSLLDPKDHADTSSATGSWVAVSDYEGTILFIQQVGTVTAGTIAGKIQDATDGTGTGVADVSGGGFTSCGTSTDQVTEMLKIPSTALRSHVRYIGTIGTGPAAAGCVMLATPKSV